MLGEYVELEYNGVKVIALVKSSISGSRIIDGDVSAQDIDKLIPIIRGSERSIYYKGYFKILGEVEGLRIPPIAPPPGTKVRRASRETLSRLFSPRERGWIRIGTLLRNPEIEVRVDINKVVQRHLAILAMTGMGKSNLVALLAREIAGLGGTIVVFDYHGEYSSLSFREERLKPRKIVAKLNPRHLSWRELARILGVRSSAKNQENIVKKCKESIDAQIDSGGSVNGGYLSLLHSCVRRESQIASRREYQTAALAVMEAIEANRQLLGRIVDDGLEDVVDLLKIGGINVVDLTGLSHVQVDAVVSHWLARILDERKYATWAKRGYGAGSSGIHGVKIPHPIVVVLEEAHIYLSTERENLTRSRAEHIAREGRKFGVGLVVVSQRPRGLDPDVLSQIGSMAIMRIVQPEDQAHIARASESITQELLEQLPGLNVGEAILIGPWVKLPAVVKIDKVEEKLSGVDVDAVAEWSGGGGGYR